MDISDSDRAATLEVYAEGVTALEQRLRNEEWLKALADALRDAARRLRKEKD